MIKKSKKLIGSCLIALMTVLSVGGSVTLTSNVTPVKAGVKEDNLAAHKKIEHLRSSLKRNYLGLKNVGTWQQYVKEARSLTKKLPNGSTKNKYTERINSAESLVNAAAKVNNLELSMQKNYPSVKNAETWAIYAIQAAEDLSKVTTEYEDQVDKLLERLLDKAFEIDEILGGNGEKTEANIDSKAIQDLVK